MKENDYPVASDGQPDLSYYTDSPDYYAAMHARALRDLDDRSVDSRLTFARQVHACWGLIANGAASIPFALEMLKSSESEAREDGAAVLAEVGRDQSVVQNLLDTLRSEEDAQARDGIVLALGTIRSKAAMPALVRIVEDESADGDTRWCAVEALGKIVRRRFLSQGDPIRAALDWIEAARKRGRITDDEGVGQK